MDDALKAVCVYCGSRTGTNQVYQEAAILLGQRLGEAGITTVYGAGTVGLMGFVARAAIDAGGDVVGVIPEHLDRIEIIQTGLTETIITQTMHERKKIMFDRSDAFVVLPGGLGTMDETFEVLTWAQLGLHDRPILVLNVDGFWDPLRDFVEGMVQKGFVDSATAAKLEFIGSVDAVMARLLAAESGETIKARSDLF